MVYARDLQRRGEGREGIRWITEKDVGRFECAAEQNTMYAKEKSNNIINRSVFNYFSPPCANGHAVFAARTTRVFIIVSSAVGRRRVGVWSRAFRPTFTRYQVLFVVSYALYLVIINLMFFFPYNSYFFDKLSSFWLTQILMFVIVPVRYTSWKSSFICVKNQTLIVFFRRI